MGKQKMEPSPEDLDPVRQQIKAWREIRKLPGPMPREIWDRAIVLARAFCLCKVARAVGLDDTGLRQKVAKASEEPGLVKLTFLELPGRVVSDEAHGGAEILETGPIILIFATVTRFKVPYSLTKSPESPFVSLAIQRVGPLFFLSQPRR